jgi:hypothetical protein
MRHSYASVAAGAGHLVVISALLGHCQAATTQRYAHLSDDPVRTAAELVGARIAAAMAAKTSPSPENVRVWGNFRAFADARSRSVRGLQASGSAVRGRRRVPPILGSSLAPRWSRQLATGSPGLAALAPRRGIASAARPPHSGPRGCSRRADALQPICVVGTTRSERCLPACRSGPGSRRLRQG